MSKGGLEDRFNYLDVFILICTVAAVSVSKNGLEDSLNCVEMFISRCFSLIHSFLKSLVLIDNDVKECEQNGCFALRLVWSCTEFLLSTQQRIRKKLLVQLQKLVYSSPDATTKMFGVLNYFLQRLASSQATARQQAIKVSQGCVLVSHYGNTATSGSSRHVKNVLW